MTYPLAANGGYTGNEDAAADSLANMKSTENNVIVTRSKASYFVPVVIVAVVMWLIWGKGS